MMGIEWFRDLSITILGFVTAAVLIIATILGFRLYRTAQSTLLLVKSTAKTAHETVSLVQGLIKPLIPILALIQGISSVFKGFGNMFNKEREKKENSNE
jgi:hypothetical protein